MHRKSSSGRRDFKVKVNYMHLLKMEQSNSCEDLTNFGVFLKSLNYQNTIELLDSYYGLVKRQILRYQSPITGLFPALSSDNDVASVRDSIYCTICIWALYQSYKRIDDDRGKAYELGQSAIKCMRGILFCWMQQAERTEKFKMNQNKASSLHVKFHLHTGDPYYADDEYNHLQIDVISLYLMCLVQMISVDLYIIYSQTEVAFVQNLVYYIERAYRTPDFGMWERGSKSNDGTAEIHSSSIGLAKSALEAINGCNLYGNKACSCSVVYADIDAHNRNRSIFETLLPRESPSKGADSALLFTISFPTFAIHDETLYQKTKDYIVSRLQGNFGFKRFCRDGYKCSLEDEDRRYYKKGEIQKFEGIECEWPLIYLIMIIDGVFKSLPNQVKTYKKLLSRCIRYDDFKDPIIPQYYYVPKQFVDDEKLSPNSVEKFPSDVSEVCLWNQSLYIIVQLLTNNLLHISELDPIRRYLPSYNRPKKSSRYSVFQGTMSDLVVQIVLVAESMRLQAMMATYGIQTQTPHELEPVQIWSSNQLIKVYESLGVSKKLHLSGRPSRPIGSLGTSKFYRICGTTILCYPMIFEVSQFYLYRDMALLIDDIKAELKFVGRYWRLSGRPTVCLLVREEHMRDVQFNKMLDLLAMLKKGYCDDVKVRIGRIQNLISSSCLEHLDFISSQPLVIFKSFKQLEHDYIGYQSLTDIPRSSEYKEVSEDMTELESYATAKIQNMMKNTESIYLRCKLFKVLISRGFNDNDEMSDDLQKLYSYAGTLRYWKGIRYTSSLLKHLIDSISPCITAVLVHGKQISVGVVGKNETVFDKPLSPSEIQAVIYSTVQPHNIIEAVLQQEIISYCGRLITTNTDLFHGILKIRVAWVLEAMRFYLQLCCESAQKCLDDLSPFDIRRLLFTVLSSYKEDFSENLSPLQKRVIEGCLCRVPMHFYLQVWNILMRTRSGISCSGVDLIQENILTTTNKSDLMFALSVEQMLIHIKLPERRQVVVELLNVIATILVRNPELKFTECLDLDNLIEDSITIFENDDPKHDKFYDISFVAMATYLARAVVNTILNSSRFISEQEHQNTCQVH